MLTGLAALENTDWSRLNHAYGRATDTPGHLRALLHDDPAARKAAMEHLWSAVIHQGTPWTATGPAALVVAGLLADERIDLGEPIRVDLLSFLVSVAEAPEEMGSSGRAARGCLKAAPIIMKILLEELKNTNSLVRACAAVGATRLAKIEPLRQYAQELEPQLLALARAADDANERSAHVMALGHLGVSPVAFLDDPSPAVRMCAALAPNLSDNPAALDELLTVLERHAGDINDWFAAMPFWFGTRPRFAVVARLVRQVKDFDKLVEAAIAVVRITEEHCVNIEWGPLLAAAFSDGSGVVKTTAQRRFLAALIERKDLWDDWEPMFGNPLKWFKQAGLPFDRKACAERVKKA